MVKFDDEAAINTLVDNPNKSQSRQHLAVEIESVEITTHP